MERILVILFILITERSFAAVGTYDFDECSLAWRRSERGFSEPIVEMLTGALSRKKIVVPADPNRDVDEAILKVYATYRLLLKNKKKSKEYIDQFIEELMEEDEALDKRHLKYFVYRDPKSGEIEGVARVQLILKENTVVFARLVALPRPNQTPVAKELAYSASVFLAEVFGERAFKIISYTNETRVRLYSQAYHFEVLQTPEQTGIADRYKVGIDGQTFIFIYAGHINKAYDMGIQQRDPDGALALLADVETRYKLQDYMPTQHAKEHLMMMQAVFNNTGLPRWSVVHQMSREGKNDANIDFEIIYFARSIYDLQRYRGTAEHSYKSLEKHLSDLRQKDIQSAGRIKYFEELSAFIRAHAGDTSVLRKMRLAYGDDLLVKDKSSFERFLKDFISKFPDSIVPNIETNEDLFRIKLNHIDPSFHDFVQYTNPLIHQFLAKLYRSHGLSRIADTLLGVANAGFID